MKEIKANEYRKLDFSKLTFSEKRPTTEEALRDVEPFPWSEDILNGERIAIVKKGGRKDVRER